MIKRTPEEIQELNRLSELGFHQALICQAVIERNKSKDSEEIKRLNDEINEHRRKSNELHTLLHSTKPTVIENVDEEVVRPHN